MFRAKKKKLKQKQKADEAMEKTDRLTQLPDGNLSKIVSLLPLKEAIRTSILSRSWTSVWTNRPDFIFDSINILGTFTYNTTSFQSKLTRKEYGDTFINRVDNVMCQRFMGPKIDTIAIRFPFGEDNASFVHVTRWISCAVLKGVDAIELDFSEFRFETKFPRLRLEHTYGGYLTVAKHYTFPCWLLASSGNACSVKHLLLDSCSLGSLSNASSLTSLVTVELRGMDITDEQLEGLLSSCLLLERMVLHWCNDLVNLKIKSPISRLKFLTIQNCLRNESIEICSENLEIFEYKGQSVPFSFKNVPKLVEVFLFFVSGPSMLDGLTYALSGIAYDLPQLKTLNLTAIYSGIQLPEKIPAFINMEHLVLCVSSFCNEDKLCWISYILKACPLLKNLQLNLYSPGIVIKPEEIDRDLPECPHEHLKELEINGFYGNQHEFELLKYIVNNAVGLDLLVINPCQKSYRARDDWSYRKDNDVYKLSKDKVERLRGIVPPTVRVKML